MLGINWSDVMNVVMSVLPQLIVIGVVLVLAIIVTVAVNKKTVADTATRKLIHSESWLVFLVAAVASVSMMLFGPLATLLNSATATKYTLSEETISNASDLAKEIQSEAITLLQNTDDNLPLADTNVNVFGWASTNPVYGGTGSGSMNANYETTSILQGMAEAGLTTTRSSRSCTPTTVRTARWWPWPSRIGPCRRCRPPTTRRSSSIRPRNSPMRPSSSSAAWAARVPTCRRT